MNPKHNHVILAVTIICDITTHSTRTAGRAVSEIDIGRPRPGQPRLYIVKPMLRDLETRLTAINWEAFTHPCGFQSHEIPLLLIELNSESTELSLGAASRLWNVVSHQGNVGSSSVPTLPFLLERLEFREADVQEEILDIIYQFACAVCPRNDETWAIELRNILKASRPQFVRLSESQHDGIRSFAEMILEQIDATDCKHIDHK